MKTKITIIENIIFTIIGRVLIFPFFIGFALVTSMILFFIWTINYIIFGGEFMVYSKKINRKTISETYGKLFDDVKDK